MSRQRPGIAFPPATLQLFLDVAEMGSLTKAAALRGSAQSQISRQIGMLERGCGGRLFHRTGRGIALTELGERILPRVRAWLADTDELFADLRSMAGEPVGDVRLGVLPSTSHPLITTVFRRAHERYPGVRLSVREGQGNQIDTWLDSARIDLAILFRHRDTPRPGETVLWEAPTYLVGPRGCALSAGDRVEFARLAGLPMILPCRPSAWRDLLDEAARQHRFAFEVVMEADSLTIQKETVAAGGVYTILGPDALGNDRAGGRLQASRIVRPDLTRHVTMALARHGPLTLACRKIAALIEEAVGDARSVA
ncbi:MAG: LysR family transcriptional regulator [Proteobacteria bacterium]|nr:LysR family transcriptional regulator [Burkholderiales bacterium]